MTVDPWRVAQIAVERGPGHEGSRGSGYLIAPGRVLTAAHVVARASVVRVRLDVGQDAEIDVQAESWWADPAGHQGTDLAVITIPEAATAGRTFESARFGRISDCAAVLTVEAFGFPLFKLRDAARQRGPSSGCSETSSRRSVTRRWRPTAVRALSPSTWTTLPPASRQKESRRRGKGCRGGQYWQQTGLLESWLNTTPAKAPGGYCAPHRPCLRRAIGG